MSKVTLIFPCDFEIDNRERQKLQCLGYIDKGYWEKDKNICETNLSDIAAPFYSYISPLIEINNHNVLKTCNINVNHKSIINEIFDSCLSKSFKTVYDDFIIDKILYPYGISITSERFDSDRILTLISDIENSFKGFVIDGKEDDKNKPNWIIYDKPIILVECDKNFDISKFEKDTFIATDDTSNKIQIETVNDAVFYQKDDLTEFITSVIPIIIALKQTSSYVRVWSKAINYRQYKLDSIIMGIHTNSAVFEEIRHSTIFRRKIEKQIFQLLYKPFGIDDMSEQTKAAKEYVDFRVSNMIHEETNRIKYKSQMINEETHRLSEKADKINTVVFIIGYISLVLSFLSFVPIELKNILWLKDGNVAPFTKICFCIVFVCSTIAFCNIAVHIYNKRNSIYEYFKGQKIIKWLIKFFSKQNQKWKMLKLKYIINFLLWLVVALIFFAVVIFVKHFICGTFEGIR